MERNDLFEDAISRITSRNDEDEIIVALGALFDQEGVYLGRGPIFKDDIGRLIETVGEGECVAILSGAGVMPKENVMEHLMQWAIYLIAEGKVHYCRRVPDEPPPYEIERNGLTLTVIGEKEVRRLLGF